MSKVWFVTGSSRGLGLAIVEAILKSGASVIATARNPQQLQHLVDKYGGDRVLPVALDVSNYDQAISAVHSGIDKFGRIDFVVNNAGYADLASVEDMDVTSFRTQVETNFLGVVYVTKAVLPVLRQQGHGHIFQVSSVGGRTTTPGLSAYQSAKWAIGGFSSSLAQEVAPLGINVTVLEPGGMKTDWAGSSMKIAPVSEPYQQTVGVFGEFLQSHSGAMVSDPVKVADLVLKVSEIEDPPLRLLVGPDTLRYAAQVADALAAGDKKWAHLTTSTRCHVTALIILSLCR